MTTLDSLYDDHLQTLRARTDDALAACGFDSLAIHSGRLWMQFLDDQPYPFKVNPHFKSWVPLLDAPDCWILYEPARPIRLLFLQPDDYWHKTPAMPREYWASRFEIIVMREATEARAHLMRLPNCALIGEWQAEYTEWGIAAGNPNTLLDRLHYHRAIKTPYELECMRQASLRGARGHKAAEAAFRAGASEFGIHVEYLRATQHDEASLPYPNIIALNEHAAVLHYQHQERQAPAARRSFLIDAGSEVAGYASDITRTYSAGRDDFQALIDGMDRLQLELCNEVRSGTDYANIHLSAHRRIAGLLRDADVINASAEEALASGLSAVFFPHGIGHLLGLQVHDVSGFTINIEGKQKARPPGHPHLRLTRTLEPGFVVTIEPGLYFIESLLAAARKAPYAGNINWKQVERLKPCGGIRIEDDVACTQGEPENLTRAAFRQIA
ncbi:MAG TPA: Xaa-Pro dipeptidase [Povalibacter sp.]|uniref:Xaa-Pro dipeptidase n=1 Tax=Povalibacter sp. TaxID=1962978 RepID=UPI002B985411|nr:Xaa-Pro dipeptidase [Povalibacter sp.]HMN45962.1 Xaa-Pro dipeptidase [Povalibacter sp.]